MSNNFTALQIRKKQSNQHHHLQSLSYNFMKFLSLNVWMIFFPPQSYKQQSAPTGCELRLNTSHTSLSADLLIKMSEYSNILWLWETKIHKVYRNKRKRGGNAPTENLYPFVLCICGDDFQTSDFHIDLGHVKARAELGNPDTAAVRGLKERRRVL